MKLKVAMGKATGGEVGEGPPTALAGQSNQSCACRSGTCPLKGSYTDSWECNPFLAPFSYRTFSISGSTHATFRQLRPCRLRACSFQVKDAQKP